MIFQKPPMSSIEQHRAAIGSHASRMSSSSWRMSSKRRKENTYSTSSCSSLPSKVGLLLATLLLLGSLPWLLPPSSTMGPQVHCSYTLSFMCYFPGTSQDKLNSLPAACLSPLEQCCGRRGKFLTFKTLLLSTLGVKSKIEVISPKVPDIVPHPRNNICLPMNVSTAFLMGKLKVKQSK